MDEEQLQKVLEEASRRFEERVQKIIGTFSEQLAEANKLYAASEERCAAAEKRAQEREEALDKERKEWQQESRTLQRRQVEAWERIAAAAERSHG